MMNMDGSFNTESKGDGKGGPAADPVPTLQQLLDAQNRGNDLLAKIAANSTPGWGGVDQKARKPDGSAPGASSPNHAPLLGPRPRGRRRV
jgi:hypothetical protein